MWLPLFQPYSPLKLVILLFLEPTPAFHPLAFVHASTTVEASFFLHHLPLSSTSKPLPLLMAAVSRDYHTVKPSVVLLVQFSSVTQSCSTLCDPMNRSTPGFPVHHHLPEPTQTHVHWVSDTIQPSHSLSSPSPPAFNLSQHRGLFQWVSSLHQVAKGLEFQLQHQSFQWTPKTDLL